MSEAFQYNRNPDHDFPPSSSINSKEYAKKRRLEEARLRAAVEKLREIQQESVEADAVYTDEMTARREQEDKARFAAEMAEEKMLRGEEKFAA